MQYEPRNCARCSGIDSDTIICVMPAGITPYQGNILLQFHFPFIDLDAFVVMPDHIHGIIVINRFIGTPIVGALHATPLPLPDAKFLKNVTMSSISPKSGSLSIVIRSYKSAVTKHVHKLKSGFPGNQVITILSSVPPGNCPVSENIF